MKYRAEIDGLRALAVVPVILFHAGFELFSGGFVGVDIFFVISGYLITTILIEDIERNRFSILNFYERRARRILPALFLVMILCIPFAWMWMLPIQMKDFSQGLIAVSLFVSNILFWRQSGYFGPEAEENPLLHTWSLAVEEQYYLLFPVFLILAWRYFGKNKVFWMIVVFAAISLAASEWGWRNNSGANFFLAPTRAWELFAGSIAAFVVQKRGVQSNNILSLLGLFALIFAVFAYDEGTPFPSVFALVPVCGVVLLVLFAEKETFAARLLGSKAFVGIGLISYSAYLWHQPLFAFARIQLVDDPSVTLMLVLSATSIVLAYGSWRFIEGPFRNKNFLKRQTIFLLSSLVGAAFILFGVFGQSTDGFKSFRFTPSDRAYLDELSDDPNYVVRRFNALKETGAGWDEDENTKNILLIGDSYAQDLVNAIYESGIINDMSLKVVHIDAVCGNLFLPYEEKADFISLRNNNLCIGSSLMENNSLKKDLTAADEVWLASSWKDWQVELLPKSLNNFHKLSSAKIVIFGRKDFPNFAPKKYLGLDASERAEIVEKLDASPIKLNNDMMSKVGKDKFINVEKLMCEEPPPMCKIFDHEGHLKTQDGYHLTIYGAIHYGNAIKELVAE
ncbi:MAG: acyltransferase [Cellvibrionaceae bacterium]